MAIEVDDKAKVEIKWQHTAIPVTFFGLDPAIPILFLVWILIPEKSYATIFLYIAAAIAILDLLAKNKKMTSASFYRFLRYRAARALIYGRYADIERSPMTWRRKLWRV